QCRRGNAVAMRLVAFGAGWDAGNEDEVANGQRRRKARGRPAGEMLVLEMGDFESGGRYDAERLDVHVGARQQQALLRDRGRWRDSARQEFAPHLLIGRHGLNRRVVLIGAYEVGAVGAGRAQHRVDVLPDAKGLLFALGQAGVWGALRQHVRCDAVLEILRHDASGKHPATGLDALREFDLARPELDGKQRLCILVSHLTPSLQSSFSIALQPRKGRIRRIFDSGMRSTHYRSLWHASCTVNHRSKFSWSD